MKKVLRWAERIFQFDKSFWWTCVMNLTFGKQFIDAILPWFFLRLLFTAMPTTPTRWLIVVAAGSNETENFFHCVIFFWHVHKWFWTAFHVIRSRIVDSLHAHSNDFAEPFELIWLYESPKAIVNTTNLIVSFVVFSKFFSKISNCVFLFFVGRRLADREDGKSDGREEKTKKMQLNRMESIQISPMY